jgi:hypothetical protein
MEEHPHSIPANRLMHLLHCHSWSSMDRQREWLEVRGMYPACALCSGGVVRHESPHRAREDRNPGVVRQEMNVAIILCSRTEVRLILEYLRRLPPPNHTPSTSQTPICKSYSKTVLEQPTLRSASISRRKEYREYTC